MVNIKDVAKEASLSVATVSRYMNNNGYVSEASKKKIEQAIKALHYKPNEIARSLSKKKSNIIGLIVPDIKNPYFPQLARAVEDTAWVYDYTIVLCNSDGQVEKELLYVERLTQKYVAGLIVTTNLKDASHYERLDVPIVALDREINENIPSVTTDNISGAKKAAKHLLQCGANNILCLRGPEQVKSADDRLTGFVQVMEENDSLYSVVETTFDFQSAALAVELVLTKNPTIDGIFASSDMAAIAAIHVAHKLHIKVPEQLQIIGFDGIELGEIISPPLTTVGQDLYEMGTAATKMLISQIEGKAIHNKKIVIDAELITRGTTRKGGSQ